ncbi:hypothetical protein FK220_005090 [Flavobacteriaceae bacterium TP-CH-4]|uniref:Uncharacterized protein n=1 Tax=Pelagihabitans pacificus TaxID=2696054 RepID=A0A967AR01_9FLAO|nr:hypothetical protein [Pelagihabitans pacificus]NHF58703.1 hypothetical protein [Pelagihabitans pacificus]
MKLAIRLFIPLFLISFSGIAQNKYEREHRIRKAQFPEKALSYISEKLVGAKKIRFYKEIDSTKVSYEVKFKKDRLRYSVEFSEEGVLEDVEILIKEVDIPNDTFARIQQYLQKEFTKYHIRRMQQQYPLGGDSPETTINNAFQNLMLPSIKYEFIVAGKQDKEYHQYEVLFDNKGNFEKLRKSLPANYDHVLY